MSQPGKGPNDYYAEGDWNAICDNCGRKRKASEMVKTWDGLYSCPHHVGITRHPQDFVRGIPDDQAAPWTRSQGADTFIEVHDVLTVDTSTESDGWLTTDSGEVLTS